MKNLTLLFFAAVLAGTAFSQRTGDVTIYSNTGERFYVILNGIRQNQEAETNVKITGLSNNWYSCRILAEDQSFDIEKNIGVKSDSIITYRIIKKRKKYKMRYYSEASLGTAPTITDQRTIVYHPTEDYNTNNSTNTEYLPGSQQGNGTGGGNQDGTGNGNRQGGQITTNGTTGTGQVNQNAGSTSTTTTTTTTTSTTNSGTVTGNTTGTGSTQQNGGGNVSVGIQVDENGNMSTSTSAGSGEEQVNINMNVNVSGTGVENNGNTSTTYEETTVTTTTTTNGHVNHQNNQTDIYQDQDVAITSAGGCGTSDADMIAIKKAMEAEAFADDKMILGKQFAQKQCMSIEQVRELTLLFDFAEDRMTFLKAAYPNCLNQNDYYQLSSVFDFSSDKEDFNKFLSGH